LSESGFSGFNEPRRHEVHEGREEEEKKKLFCLNQDVQDLRIYRMLFDN
jgi:hypothetical protein